MRPGGAAVVGQRADLGVDGRTVRAHVAHLVTVHVREAAAGAVPDQAEASTDDTFRAWAGDEHVGSRGGVVLRHEAVGEPGGALKRYKDAAAALGGRVARDRAVRERDRAGGRAAPAAGAAA